MVEKILIYERDAFFALNGSDSAFLDRFMWIFTGKAVWLPLAIPVPAKCLVRLGLPTKISDCNGYLVLGARLLNRWLVSIQACRRCC